MAREGQYAVYDSCGNRVSKGKITEGQLVPSAAVAKGHRIYMLLNDEQSQIMPLATRDVVYERIVEAP